MFKKDFATQLTELKETFSSVLDKSKKLSAEINVSIVEKQKEIERLSNEMNSLNEISSKNDRFAENISKIVE